MDMRIQYSKRTLFWKRGWTYCGRDHDSERMGVWCKQTQRRYVYVFVM